MLGLILFFAGLAFVVFKILFFGLKMTWGLLKLLLTVFFLPVILITMVVFGLMSIAAPILVIVGIIAIVMSAKSN